MRTKKNETPRMDWGRKKLMDWWAANKPALSEDSSPDDPLEELDEYIFAYTECFPGCCAFSVAFDLNNPKRPKGWTEAQLLAAICLQLQEDKWGEGIAPFLLATTVATQRGAIAILQKIGFVPIHKVRNSNTDNMVTLWQAATKP